MSRKIHALLLFICLLPVISFAAEFKEGTDYKVISVSNNSLQAEKGKVSVVEFFSPGCPACFKFEPTLDAWLKHKPSYVIFSRVPLAFEAGWDVYQKAYFVADALGKTSTILPALFNAIHVTNEPLASEADLTTFFAKQGIKPVIFHQLYNSPSIALETYHATDLMKTYKVYSIPTVIVNGKYAVSPDMAGSATRMIQILDYLIKKAH